MTDWNPRTNGTLRGFLIIIVIAAALTAAGQAGAIGIALVFLILQIAFVVVIALFLFRLWRQNREEIATWPARVRAVFYGAAALALANIVLSLVTVYPSGGLEALVFFFVLAACVFSMWRAWRDQHTYGYG
jgi:tellurite resistance protein TehA-like permease